MRILLVNKFLHPNGGSETYVFKLGAQWQAMGHEVQYFGMEHPDRVVGNRVNAYTSRLDFHDASVWAKLTYPFRTVYSLEAARKIRRVLEDFRPDVCHLNNFNYQLTPSILLAIRKWEKQSGHRCKIVYTAHDYQLVCPNHMCNRPATRENCEQCLNGRFWNCTKNRCIHNSFFKSLVGTVEARLWNWAGVYKHLDTVVCCSAFMKTKLDTNPLLADKTVTLHNFVEYPVTKPIEKKDYVLYFGRYSAEKGVETLVQAAKAMPDIPFVFAGSGPLKPLLEGVPNVTDVGFVSGDVLESWVREARFTVYPSEWYENCPFSVMESLVNGTPVLGAAIGGVPELIRPGRTGELFAAGDLDDLCDTIRRMWDETRNHSYPTPSKEDIDLCSVAEYGERLITMLEG